MSFLRLIRQWMAGRKTYLGMIAAGALGILWSCGLVDDQSAEIIAAIITTWTGISIRAAIAKAER